MKDKDFNRLVEGVKQFIRIKRGEIKPARVFELTALDARLLFLKDIRNICNYKVGKFINYRVR